MHTWLDLWYLWPNSFFKGTNFLPTLLTQCRFNLRTNENKGNTNKATLQSSPCPPPKELTTTHNHKVSGHIFCYGILSNSRLSQFRKSFEVLWGDLNLKGPDESISNSSQYNFTVTLLSMTNFLSTVIYLLFIRLSGLSSGVPPMHTKFIYSFLYFS